MSVHKWDTPHAVETVLSTELDSLAMGTTALSAAIDNTVGYKFADFEVVGAGEAPPSGNGAYYALWLLLAEDGTHYEESNMQVYTLTGSGYSAPGNSAKLVGALSLVNRPNPMRGVLRLCDLPPTKFKVLFLNAMGTSMPGSGNSVKMLRYNEADV